MKTNITTATALPPAVLSPVGKAMEEVSASFDRFCLAAGMEALGEMMEKDAAERLRQPLHDIAGLVDLAALDRRVASKTAPDRPRQRLRAVDDEQTRHRRIEPALNQVVDERL